MKVGIAATSDVQATADRCKQLGVQRVYIQCASLPGYRENGYPDPEHLREFKGNLEAHGLEVPSATYFFARWPEQPDPWRSGRSTNPEILLNRDRRCIDAMLRMIETLGSAGIGSVLHYVDIGRPEDPARAEACFEALIDVYRELMPAAESCGVALGNHSLHRLLPDGLRERAVDDGVRLEDYGSYTTEGWGGPFLVDTWVNLRRLVESVPSPSNGVTLCTGMDIVGGDLPALVREFAGNIHFCQLRDHTDRWPAGREVPPGEGGVDLAAVVAALRDVGYRGILHPEHLGKPRVEGEDLVTQAVAYVQSLLT